MNPNTGELYEIHAGEKPPKGAQLLPEDLQVDAAMALVEGKPMVDLDGDSRLAKWAAEQRRQQEVEKEARRLKAKAARASRKRNR